MIAADIIANINHAIPKLRAAEALADAVASMVTAGAIGSRTLAADALLDYRDPPRTERSDALAKVSAELARLQAGVREERDIAAVESKLYGPRSPHAEFAARLTELLGEKTT